MIKRELEKYAKQIFKKYPILTITGPRQSGKTTLVKNLFSICLMLILKNLI